MTPRTVLILCERAPVKVNPVPAVRYGERVCLTCGGSYSHTAWCPNDETARFECSYCGRRVQVVA